MTIKWTPMEIQDMRFGIVKKGYDPEEVHGFLLSMAEQVEQLVSENEKLKQQIGYLKAEADNFRRREEILKETLLTAQKLAKEVKEQAEKEGEVIQKRAELQAEQMLSQAGERLAKIEQEIQSLKLLRSRLFKEFESLLDRMQTYLKELRGESDEEAPLAPFMHD